MDRIAVYTCITGEYDTLKEVPKQYIEEGLDFICFTDNLNLISETWTLRKIPEELDQLSDVKRQRIIKILPQRYLKEYACSLWIDGSMEIKGSITEFLKKYPLDKFPIWLKRHPSRKCIYEEEKAVLLMKKDNSSVTGRQMQKYRSEGYPQNNGLVETGIMWRSHLNLDLNRTMVLWSNEILKGSHRDQLSFNYACWKTGMKYGEINSKETFSKYFKLQTHSRKRNPIKKPAVKTDDCKKEPDVIISLTTHGTRLANGVFHKAVKSVLEGTENLNLKVVLTLFKDDVNKLTASSRKFLIDNNVELLIEDLNLKPHLKYYTAMQKYRTIPIVTIDDDCIYEKGLVNGLYSEYQKNPKCVIAKRVHQITYDDHGNAKPYRRWIYECTTQLFSSFDLLATGVGGVLYPPDILKITQDDLVGINASLTSDDLFLRKKETVLGVKVKYVSPKNGFLSYKLLNAAIGKESLSVSENTDKNDKYIKELNFDKYRKKDGQTIFKPICELCEMNHIEYDQIEVAYITDLAYVNPTITSISSMKMNKGKRPHQIYVLCDNVGKENEEKFRSLSENGFKVLTLDISKSLDKSKIKQVNLVSKTAVAKFLISEILPHLNKVLYLDCDTLILKPLDELYDKNVDNYIVGAVKDYKICCEYPQKFYRNLVTKNKGYFNSGVMLMNLYMMRKLRLSQALMNYRINGENHFMDQDALNVVFNGIVRWLDPKFNFIVSNFLYGHDKVKSLYNAEIPKGIEGIENDQNVCPIVLHMTGIPKPWKDKKSMVYELYEKYSKGKNV